jgi:hypothetical protein
MRVAKLARRVDDAPFRVSQSLDRFGKHGNLNYIIHQWRKRLYAIDRFLGDGVLANGRQCHAGTNQKMNTIIPLVISEPFLASGKSATSTKHEKNTVFINDHDALLFGFRVQHKSIHH